MANLLRNLMNRYAPRSSDDDADLEKFHTDAEYALRLFDQLVSGSQELVKRLLVVHGVGGVGKTTLLRMYRLNCHHIARAELGLLAVDYATAKFEALPNRAQRVEALSNEYSYSDVLAWFHLLRSHIAWQEHALERGHGHDVVFEHFRQSLTNALHHNRFLLDEILSRWSEVTPIPSIIPQCRARGEQGRQMLIALHDWWRSPSTETSVSLQETEKTARQREEGDGSYQGTVVEQIGAALAAYGG
ncbi:MAG TPA: hypothetical protein VJ793_07075 [Anaerolineae bacterium]|nr:hypothetical protein [Anaerolineae bacterium]